MIDFGLICPGRLPIFGVATTFGKAAANQKTNGDYRNESRPKNHMESKYPASLLLAPTVIVVLEAVFSSQRVILKLTVGLFVRPKVKPETVLFAVFAAQLEGFPM